MAPHIRLILTDIDGTILPYGCPAVPARTRAAFHAAMDAGMLVGPASGRAFAWVRPFFPGDEACCATAIVTNGMQVFLGGREVLHRTLGAPELERVADVLADVGGAGLLVFVADEPCLVAGARDDLAVAFPRYAQSCRVVGGVPAGGVDKANVFVAGDLARTREVRDLVAREVPGLSVDVPQPMFLNLMPAGWDKGAALAWLCGREGIAPEEVVVFGDGGNDVSLFARAGHPVAVEGAMPEAAAAARWHVGRCEDEAVAAAIEVLAAGGWPFER